MSLLSVVVRDVCLAVGVLRSPMRCSPASPPTAPPRRCSAAPPEMAQRVAYNTREWAILEKIATIAGTGAEAYAVPLDYKRMLVTAQIWRSTTTTWPMRYVPRPR